MSRYVIQNKYAFMREDIQVKPNDDAMQCACVQYALNPPHH